MGRDYRLVVQRIEDGQVVDEELGCAALDVSARPGSTATIQGRAHFVSRSLGLLVERAERADEEPPTLADLANRVAALEREVRG